MFLDALMSALCVRVDDAKCLFALSLLYAMIRNEGIHPRLLEAFSLKPLATEGEALQYNSELVSLLLCILDTATATGQPVIQDIASFPTVLGMRPCCKSALRQHTDSTWYCVGV